MIKMSKNVSENQKIAFGAAGGVLALVILVGSCSVLKEGTMGVRVTMGRASETAVSPGITPKWPLIQSIYKFDVQTQKRDYATSAYTKDIQPADVKMSLSFNLRAESVVFTYKNYGLDWEEKIVIPNLHQALKDEIGKQNAVELVANREEVANKILLAVNKALEDLPIRATSFQLLDISFSDVFEKAIESKVVAVQKAQEAENVTKQIQEEAKQKVISAEAEARSMTIRAQALSQNRALVSYEAVQKWDGKLPVYSLGGSVPFINIKD